LLNRSCDTGASRAEEVRCHEPTIRSSAAGLNRPGFGLLEAQACPWFHGVGELDCLMRRWWADGSRTRWTPPLVSRQTRPAGASHFSTTAQVSVSVKGGCRSKSALCRRSIPARQAESALDATPDGSRLTSCYRPAATFADRYRGMWFRGLKKAIGTCWSRRGLS
jgi:hypothetical protein